MADLDKIKQLVEKAKEQQFGTQEDQMKNFRQKIEATLTPESIQTLGLQFEWDESKDTPEATFEANNGARNTKGWIHPSNEHVGSLSMVSGGVAWKWDKPFDTAQEFLLLLDGWI